MSIPSRKNLDSALEARPPAVRLTKLTRRPGGPPLDDTGLPLDLVSPQSGSVLSAEMTLHDAHLASQARHARRKAESYSVQSQILSLVDKPIGAQPTILPNLRRRMSRTMPSEVLDVLVGTSNVSEDDARFADAESELNFPVPPPPLRATVGLGILSIKGPRSDRNLVVEAETEVPAVAQLPSDPSYEDDIFDDFDFGEPDLNERETIFDDIEAISPSDPEWSIMLPSISASALATPASRFLDRDQGKAVRRRIPFEAHIESVQEASASTSCRTSATPTLSAPGSPSLGTPVIPSPFGTPILTSSPLGTPILPSSPAFGTAPTSPIPEAEMALVTSSTTYSSAATFNRGAHSASPGTFEAVVASSIVGVLLFLGAIGWFAWSVIRRRRARPKIDLGISFDRYSNESAFKDDPEKALHKYRKAEDYMVWSSQTKHSDSFLPSNRILGTAPLTTPVANRAYPSPAVVVRQASFSSLGSEGSDSTFSRSSTPTPSPQSSVTSRGIHDSAGRKSDQESRAHAAPLETPVRSIAGGNRPRSLSKSSSASSSSADSVLCPAPPPSLTSLLEKVESVSTLASDGAMSTANPAAPSADESSTPRRPPKSVLRRPLSEVEYGSKMSLASSLGSTKSRPMTLPLPLPSIRVTDHPQELVPPPSPTKRLSPIEAAPPPRHRTRSSSLAAYTRTTRGYGDWRLSQFYPSGSLPFSPSSSTTTTVAMAAQVSRDDCSFIDPDMTWESLASRGDVGMTSLDADEASIASTDTCTDTEDEDVYSRRRRTLLGSVQTIQLASSDSDRTVTRAPSGEEGRRGTLVSSFPAPPTSPSTPSQDRMTSLDMDAAGFTISTLPSTDSLRAIAALVRRRSGDIEADLTSAFHAATDEGWYRPASPTFYGDDKPRGRDSLGDQAPFASLPSRIPIAKRSRSTPNVRPNKPPSEAPRNFAADLRASVSSPLANSLAQTLAQSLDASIRSSISGASVTSSVNSYASSMDETADIQIAQIGTRRMTASAFPGFKAVNRRSGIEADDASSSYSRESLRDSGSHEWELAKARVRARRSLTSGL